MNLRDMVLNYLKDNSSPWISLKENIL